MPRKSILILDDDRHRFRVLTQRFWRWRIKSVGTVELFRELLEEGPYEAFSLDYDLELSYPALDDSVRPTGLTAVELIDWAIQLGMPPPELVTIHSVNPEGAALMASRLEELGLAHEYRPYCIKQSPDFAKSLIRMWEENLNLIRAA